MMLMVIRKIWSKERLGFASQKPQLPKNNCIWLHGASVGEANVLMPLINEYLKNPEVNLIISTMTKSGQNYLREKCEKNKERICFQLLPLDFWFIWAKVFFTIKPQKIIIAETEIWPAFIYMASAKKIPILLVNGRISDKSNTSYLRYRFLFSNILKNVSFIYTQSEQDKNRFIELGVIAEKVRTIGNLKNDGLRNITERIKKPLDFFPKHHRVVFGSLRPKEMIFAVEAIQKLKSFLSDMKIVICPRHFDWLEDLYTELETRKITYQISSKVGIAPKSADVTVLIIDQIGFLQKAYHSALSAFVGGTLYPEYGGHNCLEPAALGIPVFHGPYFLEQLDNTNALLTKQGSKIINSATEFVAEVEKMLVYPAKRANFALKGVGTVQIESRAMNELRKDKFFDTKI